MADGEEVKNTKFDNVAIGDIGTQLFCLGETKFEYLIPVTAGAEFGGETESFDAPETDLDYIPKIMGRKSLNDVEYTIIFSVGSAGLNIQQCLSFIFKTSIIPIIVYRKWQFTILWQNIIISI